MRLKQAAAKIICVYPPLRVILSVSEPRRIRSVAGATSVIWQASPSVHLVVSTFPRVEGSWRT